MLGLVTQGRACTFQNRNLWELGMRVPDPCIKGGAAWSETGSLASWACVVGGHVLSSWGGAYSFWGGACRELDMRLRGVKRGGASRRGLGWPELARASWGRMLSSLTPPGCGMASPRELTQNPLKKIWMPYSNGRPALHACQRGGEAGSAGSGEGSALGWVDRAAWAVVSPGEGAADR